MNTYSPKDLANEAAPAQTPANTLEGIPFSELCQALVQILVGVTQHPSATTAEKASVLQKAEDFLSAVLSTYSEELSSSVKTAPAEEQDHEVHTDRPEQVASASPQAIYAINWDAVETLEDIKLLLAPLTFHYSEACPSLSKFQHLLVPVTSPE